MFRPDSFTHSPSSDPGDHLDANTLTAFSEHSLSEPRRTVVFAHLAECDACREWLASYSRLRDHEEKDPAHITLSPFGLLHSWQFKLAAGIACALILFAAISARLLRMESPPLLPAQAPLELPLAARAVPTHQPGTATFEETGSRKINKAPMPARHSRQASERRPSLWSMAWFQPVRFVNSVFDAPRRSLPGPLGRARLTRNLNFAAGFSMEEAMLPGLDQISVQTDLGKRWITLDRVSAVTRARF